MKTARGDSQPCTSPGCAGTMQYRRESDNDARRLEPALRTSTGAGVDRLGWMCDVEPDHFHYAQLAMRPDRRSEVLVP